MSDDSTRRSPARGVVDRLLEFVAPGLSWDDDQRNLTAYGLVGRIANTFVNPFMTPFALSFGASKLHISVLDAFPSLVGSLMQVPASYLVERTGKRKSLIVSTGILTRATWALVILLPLFFRSIAGVYALTVLMVVLAVTGSMFEPAWTSLVSDIVPRQVRGRFFATRNILMSIGALLAVNVAGQVVTRGGFPNGYMTSMAIFWILSWVALYFFNRVRDVPFSPLRPGERARRVTIDTEALRAPQFSTWIKISSFFNLSVVLVGPLFGAYLIQDLHGTPAHLAYMSSAATLAGILGQRFWGPISDRRGPKFAMVTSACLSAVVPTLWYFAKSPWAAILADTLSGIAWSGWGLCSFNLILDITPEAKRPSYVATGNLVGGLTGFIGPLIGGYFAVRYSLRPMMLVSAIGRLTTGLLLQRYIEASHEEPAAPAR